MNRIKHIDCMCQSFDHSMRITFDEEFSTFHIDYKLEKFPSSCPDFKMWTFYPNKPFKNFVTRIDKFFCLVKDYFTCICYAILGKPYWFHACTELSTDEAIELSKFIKYSIKDYGDISEK